MEHEKYIPASPKRRMMTPSTVPTSPLNTSWDVHYRRRGRTRERFDYALTSEELSPEVPATEYLTTDGRPRSAVGRSPYYHRRHTSAMSGSASVSTSGSSNKNRAKCLQNMFYPGELNTSLLMPPYTTTTTAPMGQPYDDEGIRYYPSERYIIPTASRSDGGVDQDAIAYAASRQRTIGQILENGRLMRTSSSRPTHENGGLVLSTRDGRDMDGTRFLERTEVVFGPPSYAIDPHDYHRSTRRIVDTQNQSRFSHPETLYPTRDFQYKNYVKENLIMYGEGLQDAPSASTGLSQEELLQRKRREETWQKRREKRVQQKKNRVVNLPSSFFSTQTTTSRHQHETPSVAPKQQQQIDYLHREMDISTGKNIEHRNTTSRIRSQTPVEKPFEDSGLAGISYYETSQKYDTAARKSVGGQKGEERQKDTGTTKTVGAGGKGVRGLMVRGRDYLSNLQVHLLVVMFSFFLIPVFLCYR
jgi:hypothetical protein